MCRLGRGLGVSSPQGMVASILQCGGRNWPASTLACFSRLRLRRGQFPSAASSGAPHPRPPSAPAVSLAVPTGTPQSRAVDAPAEETLVQRPGWEAGRPGGRGLVGNALAPAALRARPVSLYCTGSHGGVGLGSWAPSVGPSSRSLRSNCLIRSVNGAAQANKTIKHPLGLVSSSGQNGPPPRKGNPPRKSPEEGGGGG